MTADAASIVHRLVASHPDFPRPGILFRDLSPVLADGAAFRAVVGELVGIAGRLERPVDVVVGVESRGFALAGAVARELDRGFVPVRKPGKLPGRVISESYALEYGEDALELQEGILTPGVNALLLDDLLATGGTLRASARLLERAGATVAGIAVVLELTALGGRELLTGHPLSSIVALD